MGMLTFEGWVYTDRGGRLVGPVSADLLKQAIGAGEVQPADRVWTKWRNRDQLLYPALARDVYGGPPTTPY